MVAFTPPETNYVTVSGAEVAYQVIGEGPATSLSSTDSGATWSWAGTFRPLPTYGRAWCPSTDSSSLTAADPEHPTPSPETPFRPGRNGLRTFGRSWTPRVPGVRQARPTLAHHSGPLETHGVKHGDEVSVEDLLT